MSSPSPSLFRRWMLSSSPFQCRPSILNEIRLHFYKDGQVGVSDTANSCCATYQLSLTTNSEDCLRGTITFRGGDWTERGRIWETDEEDKEADRADKFIENLIRKPIEFKLKDNILNVYYGGEKYQFLPCL